MILVDLYPPPVIIEQYPIIVEQYYIPQPQYYIPYPVFESRQQIQINNELIIIDKRIERVLEY